MAVDDPEVVDFVAIMPGGDEVVLTVSDHLGWEDEVAHLFNLQEKLNRYLAFVESGEMVERFPESAGHPVRIDVVFKNRPTDHARQHLLEPAAAMIQAAGMRLSWRTPSSAN